MEQRTTQRPRIGLVHRFDARNVRSWSGTLYFMARSLEQHVGDVVYLGPDETAITRWIVNNTGRVNKVSRRLTKRRFIGDHNRILSARLGNVFRDRLRQHPCDVLFAPAASVEIAHLRTELPIVYLSDLTWANIVDYYPEFSSLSQLEREEGERIEAAAIRNASSLIFPSDWAVQTAIQHYGARPETVYRIPFGANLEHTPPREQILARSLGQPVKLLWVGVDWFRKGGPIAIECLVRLLEMNIDAELTIVGCTPPPEWQHPRAVVVPFLSKLVEAERQRLAQLFLEAHFFLFPTRAEATSIATCESSAFGLPCLITDTGGVRGAIREGVNGFLLPPSADGSTYADKIASLVHHPEAYHALVASSRDEFERALNWDAWGRSVHEVIQATLARSRARAGTPAHALG